ncbi:ABC transporter substrate-binding protein [Mesobaculum littorinae]|uniref:ABC transporter substrate-binding protein n=1 Tax=Mesobaculum littorinae TaxID=2486419 RepID=A0A438ADN7_9RHOB|nr:ABC transporter substrate-binding protein [Mesobaculum littorinae]RVV96778.1 ABC transporter substrate-binding protein [Mesobaculum littorinae]
MRQPTPPFSAALAGGLLAGLLGQAAVAQTAPDPADWDQVVASAEGQTVYWNAWGGNPQVNAFIQWTADEVQDRFGIALEHVKLSDAASAVTTVLNEKSAGRDTGGSIDLIWINGENFAAMKRNDLLFGPWSEAIPNWQLTDPAENTALTSDFTVPVDGLEAPWSMAQVVFYYDSADIDTPPATIPGLLDWARAHPGRFTYPQPPDFLGSTFLKQALLELATETDPLYAPVDEADYAAISAPLWDYLEELTPLLWRQGQAYPQTGPAQRQLVADDEIDIAISFNPGEASAAIANYELPETVRSFVLEGGTIGNASFLAIPFNANAKEGAMVVANFLMSPEAQARAQDPDILGVGTVLDLDKLEAPDRARFEELTLGVATLSTEELGTPLPEPHPSWMERIEEDWESRYGVAR